MRILLLGSDGPLGQALQDQLLQTGRHEVITLSRAACRWKSERQAKRDFRRAGCDLLLDTRLVTSLDGGEVIAEIDGERCHWLAKACQRDGRIYCYLSSYRLFSGDIDRLYSEEDYPDSGDTAGKLLHDAENRVREACEQHLVLRLGPVFSHLSPNWLPSMMERMRIGGRLELNRSLAGNPVAAPDAARVIAGVVDQVSAGAEDWGIYHYCSTDSATAYELAEAVLASASQYHDMQDVILEQVPSSDPNLSLNRALDCRKIRNTFAIKQQPWREFVADIVTLYFHESLGESDGQGKQ